MIKFEKPVAEVEKFELVDVITTSGECEDDFCWEDCPAEVCPNKI